MLLPDSDSLLRRWREADKAAQLAETLLLDHMLAYANGNAPAPTEQDRESVRWLRAEANKRFSELMGSILPVSGPRKTGQDLH